MAQPNSEDRWTQPKTEDRWTQPNSEDRERSRTRLLLVGVAFLASKGIGDGFEDDLDVEEETPVFYVPDVFLDAFFHHPELGGFTSGACDLCPTSDSGFGIVTNHVFIY